MATSPQAYGDIFYVNTPAIDRWSQQMYAEQKMRQARAQQEGAALDAGIQKELGKVRSVDTPDVINAYNTYKQLKKSLLFDKSLQKDPQAYNQVQQQANKAYSDIFSLSNKSAELNDMSKRLTADYIKDHNSYSDDFGGRMNTLMNTPISQLAQPHPQFGDLTNWDNYMYQGMNTDFGKINKEAAGAPRHIMGQTTKLPGGLQTSTPVYEYANTPAQFKEYMIGQLAMRNAGRDAIKAWEQIPEEEIANTIKRYQELPAEYWKNQGLNGPQDIFPKNPDNKAENFASYQAMKYAINNAPRLIKNEVADDKKALEDLRWNRDLMMQRIRAASDKDLAKYKKDIKADDNEMNNVWYERHLDNLIEKANKDNKDHTVMLSGKPLFNYKYIEPDAFTMKSFMREGVEPNRIGVTDKGEIVPIFFEYGKDEKGNEVVQYNKKGEPIVNTELSRPMSYDQALINLGYRGATKKQLSEDLNHVGGGQQGKKYSIDGKPYTHAQLNQMGYNDDEIDKAIKAGLIK